ncbi:MAG: hypochlorite stress DNA-binding transcriptional regulator HypT [Burkholderiales bacterium]|jgi:DNA-binding transcriptional LysR family regulator|nr:hypochlorite stress DNA-binding transcriptional regulator HypT [Burkholderiales bacterium]
MQNIETKWLEDFLALEELRNFSQAAEQRSLSQPAFSRRIRSLEHAVGVELFDRTSTPLQLTDHGRLFHSQVRSLLEQLQNGLNELSGASLIGKAKLSIAAAHSLSLAVLPAIIETIAKNDNSFICHVEAIDADLAVQTLREGKSDFILSFHDEELLQTPFRCFKLFDAELIPVCADDGHAPRFNLKQTDIPLLNYTPTSYLGRLVNRCLSAMGENTFRPVFVSSMADLLKRMTLDGYGVAWLPTYLVNEAQDRFARLDLPSIPIEAYVYRMETRLSPAAERFWRALTSLAPKV